MITSAEQLNTPDEFFVNAVTYANLTAGWAFLSMTEWGWTTEQMCSRPLALIMEIGALRHVAWLNECAKIAGLELPDMPRYLDEESDLLARIEDVPSSFVSIQGAKLSMRMFKFQMQNVVWTLPFDGSVELSQLFLIPEIEIDDLDLLLQQLSEIICNYSQHKNGTLN